VYIFEYLLEEKDKNGFPLIPQVCKRFAKIYRGMERIRFRSFLRKNDHLVRSAILVATLELPLFANMDFCFGRSVGNEKILSYAAAIIKEEEGILGFFTGGEQGFFSGVTGELRYILKDEATPFSKLEVFWLYANIFQQFCEEEPRMGNKLERRRDIVIFSRVLRADLGRGGISFGFCQEDEPDTTEYEKLPVYHPIRMALDADIYAQVGSDKTFQEYLLEDWERDFWVSDTWLESDLSASSGETLKILMEICRKGVPKSFRW
jgi:hypothetical protein